MPDRRHTLSVLFRENSTLTPCWRVSPAGRALDRRRRAAARATRAQAPFDRSSSFGLGYVRSQRSEWQREFPDGFSSRTIAERVSAEEFAARGSAKPGGTTPIRLRSPRHFCNQFEFLIGSDAIDSEHSLDASEFLRLSFGPWPRTRTIRPFSRFSCSNASTAPGTWPDFTSCRSNLRSSRIWRLCAAGVASGPRGANGSTCTRLGESRRSSSRNGSIAGGAEDTSSEPDGRRSAGCPGVPPWWHAPRKAGNSLSPPHMR